MIRIAKLVLGVSACALAACSNAPSCADERVATRLIPKIAKKFSYQGGLNTLTAADLQLEHYRIIEHNPDTGLLLCEAEINKLTGGKIRRVRYEMQRYEDKPDELHIEIIGGFLMALD